MRLQPRVVWCGILAAALWWWAAPSTPAAVELPAARVERVVLENGLILLVEEDHRLPQVAFELRIDGGASAEGPWAGTGISHGIEHMLFKGTERRAVGAIEQEVRSYEGAMNAFTSWDYTGYTLTVGSKYAARAVDLLSDVVQHATFDAKEFEKEREVILSELRMNRDDPERRLYNLLWSTVYRVHPYRHPVIGYEPLFRQLSRDDVVAYYRQTYRPDRCSLAIVGDVETSHLIALVTQAFGAWERGRALETARPAEPLQLNRRQRRETGAVQLARLVITVPSTSLLDRDLFALDVLAQVLGQGESSRLYTLLRRRRELVYGVEASNYTPRDPGLLMVSCTLEPSQIEPARQAIEAELAQVREHPITPKELAKAKQAVVAAYVRGRQTIQARAADLATHELLAHDADFAATYVRGIEAVTVPEVQRVAQQYLVPERISTVMLLPETPASSATAAPAEQAPASVAWRKVVLPNGLTVILGEDHRLPLIAMTFASLGGVRAEPPGQEGLSHLTSELLVKGAGSRSEEAIAELAESRGWTLSAFSGKDAFGVAMSVLSDDLDQGWRLFSDVIRRPAFPARALEQERRLMLAGLKAQDEDIFQVGMRALRATLLTAHPYRNHPLGRPESVAALTRADCLQFYHRWMQPKSSVLVVFGDLSADRFLPRVRQTLGRWGGRGRAPFVTPVEPPLTAVKSLAQTLPKEQALVAFGFPGVRWQDPDRYAMELLGTLLAGSGGRLYQRIREQLGLSYALGAVPVFGIDPGYLLCYVATTPPSLGVVKTEMEQELRRIVADHRITDEELEQAKRELIGQQRARLQTVEALSTECALNELFGLGFTAYQQYPEAIGGVTRDDLLRFAERYLNLKAYAVVTVTPPEKPVSPNAATGGEGASQHHE
ncbi:MAG: insulinase family protein [Candidatus Omnitrophica bacterium]|nr:insulinase family protein [Candidatus Omnitrophota bacterium]